MTTPDMYAALAERITALETWRAHRDIADARAEEQRKHMDKRFDGLEKQIEAMTDTLRWLNRVVLSGIVMAFVAFLVGGGLKIVS